MPRIGNGHLARGVSVLHALRARRPGLRLALHGSFSDSARGFMTRFLDPAVEVHEDGLPTGSVAVLDSMWDPDRPGYTDPERAIRVRRAAPCFVMISSALELELPVAPDLLVDHLPDVRIRGAEPARVLLGFDYAPVSSDFFDHATVSSGGSGGGLVAVIGGGEHQIGPERFAEAVAPTALASLGRIRLVVSPHYPEADGRLLAVRYPGLEVLQNLPSLAPVMACADAVVCTYGNVTYESLSLGRPTYVVGYKPFQKEYADYLEAKGLVVSLGLFSGLRVGRLAELGSAEVWARLAARAREVFTGPGLERVADGLLECVGQRGGEVMEAAAEKLVIAGSRAPDVLKVLHAINAHGGARYRLVGFIDVDRERIRDGYRGLPVWDQDLVTAADFPDCALYVNVGRTMALRQQVVAELRERGFERIVSMIAPDVDLWQVECGEGCLISQGCVVGPEVAVGRFSLLLMGANINHETVLDDFTFVGPNATVLGSSEDPDWSVRWGRSNRPAGSDGRTLVCHRSWSRCDERRRARDDSRRRTGSPGATG